MIIQARRRHHRIIWTALLLGGLTGTGYTNAQTAASFTLFESGQVRPLALSPDGKHLYAVNTPDARLEIFRVTEQGLEHRTSVAVGLEPVAVTARSNDEVWVVNHLSDSVSVVDVHEPEHAQVTRTLPPGSGVRMALDRDLDGYYDGDERNAGSDPANAASVPRALENNDVQAAVPQ